MYCQFYNLKEKPFNITSDPAFFFLSKRHEEAISHIKYGINERKGILCITGEIGTGKTTLCKAILSEIDKNTKTAFVLNPNFSASELFEIITKDFGLIPASKSRLAAVSILNEFLLEQAALNNNAILIIDEAQNLTSNQLEQIRLLSNLETEKEKLLQIILVGQPELNQKLNLFSLRQLRQRIAVRYHVNPLEKGEIKHYINHRLKIAGSINGMISFDDHALEEIFNFSQGTPRLVNILCDRALLSGFVKERHDITKDIIEQAIKELK